MDSDALKFKYDLLLALFLMSTFHKNSSTYYQILLLLISITPTTNGIIISFSWLSMVQLAFCRSLVSLVCLSGWLYISSYISIFLNFLNFPDHICILNVLFQLVQMPSPTLYLPWSLENMYLYPCTPKGSKSHVHFIHNDISKKMMIQFQICKNDDENIEMQYLTKDHIRNVASLKSLR